MMIYKVTVAKYTDCEGKRTWTQTVAYAATEEIAMRLIKEYREKHQVNQYWRDYPVTDEGNIIMGIEGYGVVTE